MRSSILPVTRYTKGTMKKRSQDEGVVYHAGFPNAAEDQRAGGLSLDALVVQHRASTFFWKLEAAIVERGWSAGSIVVVDRALMPHEGDSVVVVVDNAFTVRQYHTSDAGPTLLKPDGSVETSDGLILWGVVTYIVQGMRH